MSKEQKPTSDLEKENKRKAFSYLFERSIQDRTVGVPTIEYVLPYPKEDFLRFIVAEKNVLLHGTSASGVEALEPRQANDEAKASGNKNAVYAVTDPVLPIFYAIKDRKKIQGVINSGVYVNQETGEHTYRFSIPKEFIGMEPWTRGVIYIFARDPFIPEQDDDGKPSGEWTSEKPVRPIARLEVGPEDFRYLDQVEGR